jgi:hypothetical protein
MVFGSADLFGREPETRRAPQRKQKSAAPPGRRRSRQPAVPAREEAGKRSNKSRSRGSVEARYSERLMWLEAVWPGHGVRRRYSLADSSHNIVEVSVAVPRNSA